MCLNTINQSTIYLQFIRSTFIIFLGLLGLVVAPVHNGSFLLLLRYLVLVVIFVLLGQGYPEDLECEGVVEFGGVYAGCPKDAVSGQVQVLTKKLKHVQAALPPLEE